MSSGSEQTQAEPWLVRMSRDRRTTPLLLAVVVLLIVGGVLVRRSNAWKPQLTPGRYDNCLFSAHSTDLPNGPQSLTVTGDRIRAANGRSATYSVREVTPTDQPASDEQPDAANLVVDVTGGSLPAGDTGKYVTTVGSGQTLIDTLTLRLTSTATLTCSRHVPASTP